MKILLKDKVKKFKFFICVSIICATLMGVYAQNITYYIVGDSFDMNPLLYWLTILTALSIILFIVTSILIYWLIKKSSL